MENSWQIKCGSSSTPSMAPSSSPLEPRDQMNTGFHSYPHVGSDLRSMMLGRMEDPFCSNSLNFSIHRSGCADLGNSFLALLSGPPSLLQCDFQELSYPKASGSCGKLPSNGTSVTANAFGSDIPLTSSGLLSENLGNQNPRNGADFCPVVSSRAVLSSNCSGNSVLHDLQGSDLAKAVISHIVPGSEKVKGPYLSGGWHSTSAVKPNSMNVQSSQKMPLEANSSISKQSSTFMSGCPRVFCLDTTGYLLLSNTGLLGIVCLCHCFHMSVSKFCEHSGLCDVNPGDVVHMDSGETIAQWRKLYFQKFRIRVPEDQSEWDWPEGLSVTAGFVKSRAANPNLCKSSDASHRVGSTGGLVRSRQPLDHVHFPKNPHTDQKLLIDALQNEKQRNFQDVDNFLLKSSVGTSWRNLHAAVDNQMMECPISRCSTTQKFVGTGVDNGCQSISAYIDGIMKNGNPSTSFSTLQNVKDPSKDSDVSKTKNEKDSVIVGRDATSSNIELRLGQPYQPSRTSGNSILPVIGPQLFDKLGNPPKSCFPRQMIHNAASYREEDYKQYHHCAADPFNSSIEREPSQLNLGNHAFGISHAIDAARLENFKSNVAKSSVVSPLTDFNNPADNVHSKAKVNMVNGSEHMMHNTLHRSSHGVECDPLTVCWNGGNCLERQLNISELNSLRLADKGKGVGCVADASYVATDTGFGNHKQVPYSVLGGSSESAVNDKSRHLHQLSSVPSDASDARNLFSYVEKDPCLGSSGQCDHVLRSNLPLQGVSMGFPLVTSTSTPDTTRALLKQEGTSVSPYLLDENLRLLALRQIMELSKQQHALSSIINQERGKYGNSSNVQHSIVDPSTSLEQRHGPDFTGKQEVSEATMNLLQSAPTFRGSDAIKKLPSVTGLYDCCNISTFTPGIPFHPEGISLLSELSDDPIQNEQPPLRFGRSDNSVSRPSEHEICCQRVPYTYYPGKCSCEARTNYLGRNVDPKVGSSLNAFKEQMGTGSGEASMILTSRFVKDPFLVMDTSIALDESGKLNGKHDKNIVCHTSQWRDVPTKVKAVCDATVVARLANVFDRRELDGCQRVDASTKYFNGAMQIADSLKDQENSNVSSGCSAPAITQVSSEVNNIDFSTVDAGDTGDVSNHIVDEGSGIDKCWSSDDALGSERSAEFLGSSCNIKLRKAGSSHIVNNESRSLLDELKLIDSLTWKKSRNQIHSGHQIHTGLAICGKSNTSQKTESGLKIGKRKKAIKLKMLSTSFVSAGPSLLPNENPKCVSTAELPTCSSKDGQGTCHTSGACLIQLSSKSRLSSAKTSSRKRGVREGDYQTDLNYDTDFGRNPEVSGRKKLRRDFASDAFREFQIQEPTHEDAEKTDNSVGCIRTSSSPQVNVCYLKARPVVCGKYGEISCGKDVSKPAKIVPLSRILKTASRCTLPKSCKPRLTSMRDLKKTNSTLIDLACAKLTGLKNEEDNGSCDVTICDKMNRDSSMEETYKAWCSDKQFAKKLSVLEKERDDKSEKDRSILDGNIPAQLKLKCKEIRKRSIYELTIKGKKSCSNSIPLTKIPDCIPEMKVRKILKNAEDSNHDLRKVCSNKSIQEHGCLSISNSDAFCCVCGRSNQDDINCLLECGRCLIRVHQACYGVSKIPKGHWYCRPCRTNSKDIVCVLCGYGGGAMTRALRSRTVVKGILKAWNVETDCRHKKMISSAESLHKEPSVLHSSGSVLEGNSFRLVQPVNIKSSAIAVRKMDVEKQLDFRKDSLCCVGNLKAHNSITAGVLDSTVKQWVHMVCGLWTPRTRCPNVDTMTAFDVSGASHPRANVVCSMCNRPGGSCIECRVVGCHIQFHPWCAHQKGLLQSEIEGVANENVGFYGRCVVHATYATSESYCDPINSEIGCQGEKELTCARTEGYKGRKQDDHQCDLYGKSKGKGGCLVPQEQLNAWIHINGQKPCTPGLPKLTISDIEYDCRKEYARYKQAKGWKHLVVYKSGIHALGLYTSRFISRGEMVVEYVGEIVGLRVADKRENEYQSGRKLQYKSACYFFRIDKEHIIDATRKGGIARFVNHSCLPNCVAKVISVRTEKKVVFFAERDIFPGEEITYDYHFNHEDEGKKIPCFCNSKNCRRYLN
ncbi:uncharacterized protein LOC132188988 isoform X3 [Corylus avellana]|uniref:uncharacterized protein LOC132188988 isoform X3 n=1 Tax=Corylus avellana TaxID=13451 RepID=UPI00286B6283|nr:uncharacterized protein LOC132188988 isoform X3 [Corylus avellana]